VKEKIRYGIQKIRVNTASYNGVEIEPTLVNFFYGNNGTGKSTIAKTMMKKKEGLTWESGYSADDYTVLVFDRKFIEQNFQGYGNIHGVYTVGEVNAGIQRQIDEKDELKKIQDTEIKRLIREKKICSDERSSLWDDFKDKCWKRTDAVRRAFPASITGFGKTQQFSINVNKYTPIEHDLDALQKTYEAAFSASGHEYPKFKPMPGSRRLSEMNDVFILLEQMITSSGDTEFARFVKALNSSIWLAQGHNQYHHTQDNKCP
jgi:energy-coupling factor transporter ATP-binding protein EcfA2